MLSKWLKRPVIAQGHTRVESHETIDPATAVRIEAPATLLSGPTPAVGAPSAFDIATMAARADGSFDAATVVADGPAPTPSVMTEAPLPVGTVLNGRYEIIKPIGRGGFSYVYLCQHVRNGRLNAVKEAYAAGCGRAGAAVVAGSGSQLDRAMQSLLREVSAISRLDHPGVARFEDVFGANGTLYFAMDFVEGESLSSLLGRRRGLSAASFADIAQRLIDAVAALHTADVLHGDIKPANIILRKDKSLVLIDFGSAERLSDLDYSEAVVTPGFSAPERYSVGGDVGVWSDVYSCAATLGAAMAGMVPPGAADVSTTSGELEAFLDSARSRMPDRPQWHSGIQHGLRADVSERVASISELRIALGFANSTASPIERSAAASDGASVFVSYAHKDSETVETFVRALQRRGAGVWIDRKGIQPGSRAWGAEILKGMRGAQVVLLFASSNAMASESVKEEIYLAKDLRKPILVARLDEVPFADDIHLFLTRTQHIAAATLSPIEFASTVVAAIDMRKGSDLA